MKHRSLGPGEMGVALLLSFSAILGALTWAHRTPPPVPDTVAARSDSIDSLQAELEAERKEIRKLRRRADSLTASYEGVPRWAR